MLTFLVGLLVMDGKIAPVEPLSETETTGTNGSGLTLYSSLTPKHILGINQLQASAGLQVYDPTEPGHPLRQSAHTDLPQTPHEVAFSPTSTSVIRATLSGQFSLYPPVTDDWLLNANGRSSGIRSDRRNCSYERQRIFMESSNPIVVVVNKFGASPIRGISLKIKFDVD